MDFYVWVEFKLLFLAQLKIIYFEIMQEFKTGEIFDFRIIILKYFDFLELIINLDFELINWFHTDLMKYIDFVINLENFNFRSYIYEEALFHLSTKLKITSYFNLLVSSIIHKCLLVRSLNSKLIKKNIIKITSNVIVQVISLLI